MTFTGFICVLIGHGILYFDSDAFEYPCYSPKAYILFAFFIFLYHIIDSSDGKQARRIGNSTPLGAILDHGLDSISVTLFFMPWG
jgi:phosphatidylglycerophosphate synthase